MKLKALVMSGVMLSSLYGADDINSEFSHFTGGAVIAGGITAVVDSFYPEYRADRGMIGFGISSAIGLLDQTIQYAEHGRAGGQLLDTAAHIAGAALGAWVTDQYILSPVIMESASEGKYIGLNVRHAF